MKYVLPALLAILACAWLSGPSEARTRMLHERQAQMPAATPEQFIQKVASSNQLAIQTSQLALDKSKNDRIRQLAQRIIDDHTKLGDELKATLQQANIPLPNVQLNPNDQAQLNKLKKLNGAAFDRAFAAGQFQDHMQAMRLVETYSKIGTNEPLKQLASQALPVLQGHLKMVEALRAPRAVARH
jgi:putative membrane protein